MTSRREAILKTFKSIQDKTGKNYCFPPYKRIQEILLKFYGEKACRRTIYGDLEWLKNNGFIHKQHRSRNPKINDAKFKSNLYWLKGEAYKYLNLLWYWCKKHVHPYRGQKIALDKLPSSKVSSVNSLVSGVLDAWNTKELRLKPSEAIL